MFLYGKIPIQIITEYENIYENWSKNWVFDIKKSKKYTMNIDTLWMHPKGLE